MLAAVPLWAWVLVRRSEPPLPVLWALPLISAVGDLPGQITRFDMLIYGCALSWSAYAVSLAAAALLQPGEPAPWTWRRWPVLLPCWAICLWEGPSKGPLGLMFFAVSLLGLRDSPRIRRVWTKAAGLQLATLGILAGWLPFESPTTVSLSTWLSVMPLTSVAALAMAANGGARALPAVLLGSVLLGALGGWGMQWSLRAPERQVARLVPPSELPTGPRYTWKVFRGQYLPKQEVVALSALRPGQPLADLLVAARGDELLGEALREDLHLVYLSEQGMFLDLPVRPGQIGILVHPAPDGFVYDDGTPSTQSPAGCGREISRILDPSDPWTAQQLVTTCAGAPCGVSELDDSCIWTPEYGWHYPEDVADCVGP